MIRAVARHAERQADSVAAYLRSPRLFDTGEVHLPPAALRELAAVLELGLWEKQGLRDHLDVDLPTYREAANRLAARCKKGPAEFEGPGAAPLSRRVLLAWIECFAWDGQDLLQADVVAGHVNEDTFVEVLADFVWRHCHELAKMLSERSAPTQ
jgi:hypothetical protein